MKSSEKETFDYTLLEKLFEEVLKEKNIDVNEKEKSIEIVYFRSSKQESIE